MIGKLVRERREAKGWTQSELALAAGLRQTYISQVEQGSIAVPRDHNLDAIGKALGITRAEFYRAAGMFAGIEEAPEPAPPSGTDDDAIVADLFEQFRKLAPPEALDVLRQMKENETPEVYRQALVVLVEAFAANAKMGTRMMRIGGE